MCVFVLKVSADRTYTCRTVETGRTVLAPYLKLWCNVKSPWPPWNSWELLDALHSSFIDAQVHFTYSGPFRSHLVLHRPNSQLRQQKCFSRGADSLGLGPAATWRAGAQTEQDWTWGVNETNTITHILQSTNEISKFCILFSIKAWDIIHDCMICPFKVDNPAYQN